VRVSGDLRLKQLKNLR